MGGLPLDIVVSMENHLSCTIDEAIDALAERIKANYYHYPQQRFLSWSRHVNSWTSADNINFLLLRYEDMLEDSLTTFTKAAKFLQLNVSDELIQKALEHTRFEKLKHYEDTVGFLHKPAKLKNFFRKGIAGDWKNRLTERQISKVVQDHGETMYKHGYLDEKGQPI